MTICPCIRRVLILCFTFTACSPAFAAEVELDFSDTYVVIAGVLSWQDPALSSFPAKNRKDQELYDTFLKLGVPKQNMTLLLDKQATSAGMLGALDKAARAAGPESTLVFYYAGHGTKSSGRTYFCNYDMVSGKASQTGFAVDAIATILTRRFRGNVVFLLADCCYSGSLVQVSDRLTRAGIQTVALTSAAASNTSTSNWTFTQTIIGALGGDPLMDVNGDGLVTLKETAWETHEAMKYCEQQMFGYAANGFDLEFPVAVVSGKKPKHNKIPKPYSFKEYVEAKPQAKWRRGRVLDYEDGRYAVQLQYYSQRPVVRLPAEQLRKLTFESYPAGSNLAVIWKKKSWKARVLKQVEGFHYITYPGYSSDWDEWVASNRILGVYEQIAARPTVMVKWGEKWWPAIVLKTEGGRYFIHYQDHDRSWDEWVTRDRIRLQGPD